MKEQFYAIYSEKQRACYGLWEYNTPDGRTVLCTSIVKDVKSCGWDDKQVLGPVTTMIRRLENNERKF